MKTKFSKVIKRVIAHYPVNLEKIKLITYKEKKAVWSIQTDIGELIIKKVPFKEKTIQFMIHAIDHLRRNKIHTPAVIKTTDGQGYTKVNNEYYVVFEAVHGRTPNYDVKKELMMILKGMASFHKASKGIEAPTGSFPSFLLTEWQNDTRKKYAHLVKLKKNRLEDPHHNEFDRIFLENVDFALEQCEFAIKLMANSNYKEWVEETEKIKTLCHQDYSAANLAIDKDGNLYVYDMDSLTVDLPIRDIRKILNKVNKKQGTWDVSLMLKMMRAYQKINPLTKDQYQVLVAEIMFPHLFYGQVTKFYNNRRTNWSVRKHTLRLKNLLLTEKRKDRAVKEFLARLDEVIKK